MRFPTVARYVRVVVAVAAFGLRARCAFGQTITEFPLPSHGGSPEGITAGPDGNLWFTEEYYSKIGMVRSDGTILQSPVLTDGAWLAGITAGPDGNLWFTEYSFLGYLVQGKIGGSRPGVVTEFPTRVISAPPGDHRRPRRNLWLRTVDGNRQVTPDGVITEFRSRCESAGGSLRSGRKSLVYRTTANRIGRMTLPARSQNSTFRPKLPFEITPAPTATSGTRIRKIGRITTDGSSRSSGAGSTSPLALRRAPMATSGSSKARNKVWRLTTRRSRDALRDPD